MGWPTPSFGSLAGTQPLSLFDTMFAQVAAMVSIPCTAGGSANAITLQPTGTAPALAAYATGGSFTFKAAANSTAAVTVQFMALAALPLYFADGTTQVTTQLVSGRNYTVFFDQTLNSNNGGYYLPMPQMPGTAGQVLTMAASGPAYAAPANTAMVLLNTLTAANVATLDDTTSLTATYSQYLLVLSNLVPVTNAQALTLRVHSAAAFQATLYQGVNQVTTPAGVTAAANGTTLIILSGNASSTAGFGGVSGEVWINNPAATTMQKNIWSRCHLFNSGSAYEQDMTYAQWQANTAVDGFRLLFGAGNISSGSVRVYGIA